MHGDSDSSRNAPIAAVSKPPTRPSNSEPNPRDGSAPSVDAASTGTAADTPASGAMALTLAQCHGVIAGLSEQVEVLRQHVARQDELLAVLHERLKLDSKNSSKPPSSDGPSSGNRAQRRASERKRGAQKGHKGSCRALLDEIARSTTSSTASLSRSATAARPCRCWPTSPCATRCSTCRRSRHRSTSTGDIRGAAWAAARRTGRLCPSACQVGRSARAPWR